MLEFFTEYGMFLAKTLTIAVLIFLLIGAVFALFSHKKSEQEAHLEIKKLNKKYQELGLSLKSEMLSKKAYKQELKAINAMQKKAEKDGTDRSRTCIFVLPFNGDIRATEVTGLRECISAILSVAKAKDEVVVLLESSGGTVHEYGLAASQLQRIRNRGIPLTVAVDKIAASGGYMMAYVAEKIIAAPFAIIGSIGVIGQVPNFNRLLKSLNIDFEQLTAGEYKRTLSLFGENTEKGQLKAQQEIEETHHLFKDFVLSNRSKLDIDSIATGEHWYGKRALELALVDELSTSDDYLCAAVEYADVYLLSYSQRKNFWGRFFSSTPSILRSLDNELPRIFRRVFALSQATMADSSSCS